MFSSTLIGRTKRPLLLALALAAVVAPTAAATPSCRTGDAPLAGGASTNPRSGAGLTARGWDYQSAGGVWATCKP
jgi:hypothetical protein